MLKALLVVTLALLSQVRGQTFSSNGYRDVVVAIHPDVAVQDQQLVIDNIKAMISSGSKMLFTATRKLAYIHSVNILLPTTWTEVDAQPVSGLAYEDSIIRIDKANPLYEDTPYTVQPRGCGERGDFIHLTPSYIENLNTTSTYDFGPPDKLFVHEWAKLRYGVFDEHGYPGDSQYPMFIYESSFQDGQLVQNLIPNFCTDETVQGAREDYINGGSCKFDSVTNLPDGNCTFVVRGDNSKVRSSLLSIFFLENMDQFCEESETQFPHNVYRPNKQNFFCNRKSAWSVVKASIDFVNVKPLDVTTPPDTIFNVFRPQDERFVFVLDVSRSMLDASRLDRLIQSSSRWVKHEVRDSSLVGVTSFSSSTSLVHSLVPINDASRTSISQSIEKLRVIGGTCLGAGLKMGLETLASTGQATGGVILFVTDGVQDCDGSDKTDLGNPQLLQRVKDSKARIITIAFGKNTDDKLENLAVISGGKVYFVPDGTGIDDINNAFEGSLTFQPSVPTKDVDIVVFNEFYMKVQNELVGQFLIDSTVGKDVKFQMDFISTDIKQVTISAPNGTVIASFDSFASSPLIWKHPFLEPGYYYFRVIAKPDATITYFSIVVTAKAAKDEQLPFFTRCWVSTGSADVDLTTTKLAILAQVSQGNRPVLNAKVVAYVERGDEPKPLTLDLLDNGGGADSIANDGIYSRYFIKYDGQAGDYTLRCQVKGDENTNFVAQRQESRRLRGLRREQLGRLFPLRPGPTIPICCGSNADSDNLAKEPTGEFERKVTGTSIKITNVPTEDKIPPNRVSDLKVEQVNSTVEISFTAPGDDEDFGKASYYDLRFTQTLEDFDNATSWNSLNTITTDDVVGGDFVTVDAGLTVWFAVNQSLFEENSVYYLAMRAADKRNLTSGISNTIQLTTIPIPEEDPGSDGLSGGAIAGIVIGCLLLVLFTAVVAFMFKKKKVKFGSK